MQPQAKCGGMGWAHMVVWRRMALRTKPNSIEGGTSEGDASTIIAKRVLEMPSQ